MTESVQVQLIISMTTLACSVVTAVVAVLVHAKVELVHKATNSMKDELVAATKVASHLEGRAEQKAEDMAGQPPSTGPTSAI